MASVVRMPSVLAGATEAAIATWLVAPGDTVAVGDPLAEIETEKAVVEYGAEEAGVVGRIVLAAGDTGEIGAPIAVLVKDGETDADIDAALGGGAPAAGAAPPARRAGPPPGTGRTRARRRPPRQRPDGPQAPPARIFASPIVRKIAREQGIDLAALAGTGPNGRIVRRDLERLAAQPQAGRGAEAAPPSAPRQPSSAPSGRRRARSSRTRRSAAPSPAA